MSCYDGEKTAADIMTFTADKKLSIRHYEDETGYGIYKYDDTYNGTWSVEKNDLRMSYALWVGPNRLLIDNVSEEQIGFYSWGNKSLHGTMTRYAGLSSDIYGYWEYSKATGTYTGADGVVHDIKDGSFSFHYIYFSKEELRNHKGYNGVVLDKREQSPRLIGYDFDGSKIEIYKGDFMKGDFVVKSLSGDRVVLHFNGDDGGTDMLDVDLYFNRVPTFLNQ